MFLAGAVMLASAFNFPGDRAQHDKIRLPSNCKLVGRISLHFTGLQGS